MLINHNGHIRDMTEEEAAEMQKWQQEHPTPAPESNEQLRHDVEQLKEENRLLKEKLNQVEILTGGGV